MASRDRCSSRACWFLTIQLPVLSCESPNKLNIHQQLFSITVMHWYWATFHCPDMIWQSLLVFIILFIQSFFKLMHCWWLFWQRIQEIDLNSSQKGYIYLWYLFVFNWYTLYYLTKFLGEQYYFYHLNVGY